MFYPTDIDDTHQILIEAPAAGAISKSDLEVRPNPSRALLNAIDLIGDLSRTLAISVGNALDGTGMDFEVTFAVRADGNGSVMLSQSTDQGQLVCRLKYSGDSNADI